MSYINLSIAGLTFDVSTHEDTVVVRGYSGHYPSIGIHIPREAARQFAADLIEAADRIDPLSPTPPDPTAASLPAAGGDFFHGGDAMIVERVPSDQLAELCRAWLALDAGVPGFITTAGTDAETGLTRLIIKTTEAALSDAPALIYSRVRVVVEDEQ